MLRPPNTSQDSKNDTHHRMAAPAEEGWYLPRDLSKNRRHAGRESIPKACEDTATTRLRNRLRAWNIIEETRGQEHDVRGETLDRPPTFIRLRKDDEGTKKIDALVHLAQTLYDLGLMPGLKRQDMSSEEPKLLAVFEEWTDPDTLRMSKYTAAKKSLYITYRYHMTRALGVEVEGFKQRLEAELAEYQNNPSRLERLARVEYLTLQHQKNIGKENRERKRGGIEPSRLNPPDRAGTVMVQIPPVFNSFVPNGGEPALKLDSLEGGQNERESRGTNANLLQEG